MSSEMLEESNVKQMPWRANYCRWVSDAATASLQKISEGKCYTIQDVKNLSTDVLYKFASTKEYGELLLCISLTGNPSSVLQDSRQRYAELGAEDDTTWRDALSDGFFIDVLHQMNGSGVGLDKIADLIFRLRQAESVEEWKVENEEVLKQLKVAMSG